MISTLTRMLIPRGAPNVYVVAGAWIAAAIVAAIAWLADTTVLNIDTLPDAQYLLLSRDLPAAITFVAAAVAAAMHARHVSDDLLEVDADLRTTVGVAIRATIVAGLVVAPAVGMQLWGNIVLLVAAYVLAVVPVAATAIASVGRGTSLLGVSGSLDMMEAGPDAFIKYAGVAAGVMVATFGVVIAVPGIVGGALFACTAMIMLAATLTHIIVEMGGGTVRANRLVEIAEQRSQQQSHQTNANAAAPVAQADQLTPMTFAPQSAEPSAAGAPQAIPWAEEESGPAPDPQLAEHAPSDPAEADHNAADSQPDIDPAELAGVHDPWLDGDTAEATQAPFFQRETQSLTPTDGPAVGASPGDIAGSIVRDAIPDAQSYEVLSWIMTTAGANSNFQEWVWVPHPGTLLIHVEIPGSENSPMTCDLADEHGSWSGLPMAAENPHIATVRVHQGWHNLYIGQPDFDEMTPTTARPVEMYVALVPDDPAVGAVLIDSDSDTDAHAGDEDAGSAEPAADEHTETPSMVADEHDVAMEDVNADHNERVDEHHHEADVIAGDPEDELELTSPSVGWDDELLDSA